MARGIANGHSVGRTAGSPRCDRLDYSRDKPPTRWPIRLDDGTRGMLSVIARPCERGDDCTPHDCGCTLSDESFWIEIRRANDQVLMRKHLWAAYQEFHLFAADIVGSPGDELLIARIPGHASPPHGWELKIWSLTPSREIGTMHVSTWFPGALPYTCAWWMATLTVETRVPKPRPIHLKGDFAATGCCSLNDATVRRVTLMKQPHALRFDERLGTYVMTGPAPAAFTREE